MTGASGFWIFNVYKNDDGMHDYFFSLTVEVCLGEGGGGVVIITCLYNTWYSTPANMRRPTPSSYNVGLESKTMDQHLI